MRMFRTFYRMTALFCHGSRSVPDPVSEYSDERPPGRGSSGADLLSVSVKFGGIVSVDL